MKVKKLLIYNRPIFYICNTLFMITRLFINILYFIFIFPFKSLYNFYIFMIQVNVFLRIKKKIVDFFDLEFNNLPLEISINGEEVNKMIKGFNWYQNSKNKVDIKGNMTNAEWNFEYNYRNIIMTLTRKGRYYRILLYLNGIKLIDGKKVGPDRRNRFEPSFL